MAVLAHVGLRRADGNVSVDLSLFAGFRSRPVLGQLRFREFFYPEPAPAPGKR